jgi:hypothetical protein
MRTNINIELTDSQRNSIAQLLDGKASKREITRKEVTELTLAVWEAVVALADAPVAATQATQERFEEVPASRVPGPPSATPVRVGKEPTVAQLKVVAELAAKHRAAGRSEDWLTGWRRGAMQVITR